MEIEQEKLQDEDSNIASNAEKLTGIIQQKLPELKISKQEVVSLLAGEAMNRSLSKVKSEFREDGIPSRQSLWELVKALGNRVAKLPSTFAKVATVLPTVALIFQTFFLGTKTEKLQDQGLDLLKSGQLMQGELSSLGLKTLSFKEDLEKQISSISKKVEPPTVESEKKEKENRKKMTAVLKMRIREQLSEPTNSTKKLTDELIGSIIHYTEYCKPYELLSPNLSPERGYMLDFLFRENIDSSDCVEILGKGNFQYADCTRKKFVKVNFSNVNLEYASFENGVIAGSNLRGVKLNHANLKGCSFWNSDLQDAEINAADLEEAKLRNAQLKNVKLNDSDISSIEFNNTADFSSVQLSGAYSFDFVGLKKMLEFTGLDSLYTLKSEATEVAKNFERWRVFPK